MHLNAKWEVGKFEKWGDNENLLEFQGTTLLPDGSGCRPVYLYYLQGMPVPFVTVHLKIAWLLVTVFYTHTGGHKSFSRNIQGDRKPLCSFSNSLLSEFQQLTDCSFLNVSPHIKETGHLRKNVWNKYSSFLLFSIVFKTWYIHITISNSFLISIIAEINVLRDHLISSCPFLKV
jgi:hypothetical protein